MAMPAIDIHTELPKKPKITVEFLTEGNVKGTFENFPRPMKLSGVNILANGTIVIAIEQEPSPIIKPNMQS